MPSIQHEALIEMFRQHPEFAVKVLHDELGVDLPGYRLARLESADLTDLTATEFRADAVVALVDDGGSDKPVLAVVVEVQLRRDHRKLWTWPLYLAKLRARMRCPVMLLVVCTDAATAGWCAAPIELGHPGWVLRPLLFGPGQVPLVTDVEQVRGKPELAVLSAMAHCTHPDHVKVLDTLAAALATIDQDRAVQYAEIVLAVLPEAARSRWEALMTAQTFEFQSAYARRLRAEAEAKGEARLVLAVLDARGIDVPEDARLRITECSDPDLLEAWGRRAVTIGTIEELFE